MRDRTRSRAATLLLALLVAPGWRLAPFASDETGTRAVAIAEDGRAAAGDGRGVWLADAAGRARRIDLAGAVRDLAFASDGALWIASEAGLHVWRDERLSLRTPTPGDLARDAARLATDGALVAVATAAGIFFSDDGARFDRIEVPLGESVASGVAIERAATGLATLWIATERGLWRAPAQAGARAERVVLDPDLRPALDVAARGDRVIVLGAGWIAARRPDGSFAVHRVVLPPGTTPQRVAASEAGVWIATERGVLAAEAPDAPFARVAAPAGTAVAWDVAVANGTVLAATSRGVLRGAAEATPARVGTTAAPASCDPPIVAVQRAALAYLKLGGDPAAAMRRGVRIRGLLPIVSLDLSRDRAHADGRFEDQAYISSDYRQLSDRDRTRASDEEIELRLTWDLGDAAYNDEQVDVSTEARRLIELRDDVLDELNQTYFDRQRALAAAAAFDPASPDAARESLRAAELAAGLDAWTDGWFGRAAEACGALASSPPR
jgi:hypothetical protein